jgi:hypothetical protein
MQLCATIFHKYKIFIKFFVISELFATFANEFVQNNILKQLI